MIVGKNKTNPTPKFMSTETQDADTNAPSFLHRLSELHNLSFFSQRQQNYEETIQYIEKSLKLVKQEKKNHDYLPSLIQLKHYKILRILQLSAALSFIKNHSLALKNGQKALKSTLSLSRKILEIALKLQKKTGKKDKSDGNEKVMKIRKIMEKIVSQNYEPPGYLLTQDWIYGFNMGNVMTVQEFNFNEWDKTIKDVFSYHFISLIVFALIACHFTISTETRLTNPQISHSKDWYKKTLSLCRCFLPSSSALYQHVFASYKKHFKSLKPEEKKSIVPSIRRISLKRSSEKGRNSSEKSQNKFLYKLSPSKKLTSTRNTSSKIRISRLKQNLRGSTPIDNPRNSSSSLSKSSTLLKDYLTGDFMKTSQLLNKVSRKTREKSKNSSSNSFDRKK
jgi:hypothetical protein